MKPPLRSHMYAHGNTHVHNMYTRTQMASLFHHACAEGRATVVQWFCRFGGGANARTDTGQAIARLMNTARCGRTAMDAACHGGHVEVCEILTTHGARVYVPPGDPENFFNSSTLLWACIGGHVHMCEWLWHHGVPRYVSYANESADAFVLGVSVPYQLSERAFHTHKRPCFAVQMIDFALFTCSHRYVVNERNRSGNSPLDIALGNKKLDVCDWYVLLLVLLGQPYASPIRLRSAAMSDG